MKKLFLAILLATLCACSSLGLQTAKDLDQQVAYAYGTLSALYLSADQAYTSKSITPEDARHIDSLENQARALLDEAHALNVKKDISTAADKLALATSILTQLQTYLATKGVK